MKGLVGGPLLMGGLGPGPLGPLKSGMFTLQYYKASCYNTRFPSFPRHHHKHRSSPHTLNQQTACKVIAKSKER